MKSIRIKILTGYLVVILILSAVAVWGIYNFQSLAGAINEIMVENYRSIKASENMVESLERQDSALLLLLRGPTEKGQEIFRRNEKEFYTSLARAEDNITIEGEADILLSIDEKYYKFITSFDSFYYGSESEKWQVYNQTLLPLFIEIKEDIRNLRELNREAMVKAQENANAQANQAMISTALVSIAAVIFVLLIGFYLTRQIISPINELKIGIKKVADRNFQQKVKVDSEDEIGQLADSFNDMINKLQEYEKINIKKLVIEKEKSEAIVNNVSGPIIVTDKDNFIVLLNQAARDLFSITKEDLNKHFLEIIPNEQLFEFVQNPEATEDKVIAVDDKDKRFHYKVSTNQITEEDEDYQFTVTLLEDVTRLKEIDNMKSEFVSTVSHEFRTPLTSMNMSLNMVLSGDTGDLNEEQEELLAAAYEDVERLTDLVNDLLDLSKIESGKIEMDFEKTDIKHVITKTVKPFQKQADDNNIKIDLEELEDNLFARADANKISWVISNLVGNALRYSPSGSEIKIGADIKGQKILVYVEDNGSGIPKEYQNKIFDKFVRAGNDLDDSGGTGLGLAISKEIINAHHGRIWLESEEGKGSKFTFYLPRYGY